MIIEPNETTINTEIEKLAERNNDGYIQAILAFCEDNNLDPSYIAKYLSKPIIEKIKAEGESINLLPKSTKLPL